MDDSDRAAANTHDVQTSGFRSKKWIVVSALLTINLLNYMDRFTIAGVLGRLQDYFSMNDKQAGMLQTVFIVFYMLFAPVCGYLGDRYSRKAIMFSGLLVWIISVFLSTLVNRDQFWLFLLLRGSVGIGEASYSTVAPSIIADYFVGPARSTVLMIFYFAIPVGSGLGYVTGSYLSLWTGSWQEGVRFTPLLGILCLFLIAVVLKEPTRGESEHAELHRSGIKEDLKYLCTVKSYHLISIGFTCVIFAVGALSWWTPTLIGQAYGVQRGRPISKEELAQVSLVFGLITCAAGVSGVVLGSTLAQAWKKGRWGLSPCPRADALVCAIGSLFSIPFLYGCLVISEHNISLAWVFMFLAVTCMCLNWSVNMDMLMYIIIANRRSTATAIQTLISHLFGDASSPYIVGLVSDAIRGEDSSIHARFHALQTALFFPTFLLVFSGAFFLWATFHLEGDQKKASHSMHVPITTWEDVDDDVETLVSDVRRTSSDDLDTGAHTG